MSLFPFNPFVGQRIQTGVAGVYADAAYIAHVDLGSPAAAAANNVLAATALTAAAQEIVAGITNPDVPRVVQIKGNQAGVAGNVVIDGVNINGEAIQDTIAANGANAVAGTKAFKAITKITLPALVGAGDSISVGCTDALGLPYCLPCDTVLMAALGGTKEATAPTVATDANALEGNTIDLNSACNGSTVEAWMIV